MRKTKIKFKILRDLLIVSFLIISLLIKYYLCKKRDYLKSKGNSEWTESRVINEYENLVEILYKRSGSNIEIIKNKGTIKDKYYNPYFYIPNRDFSSFQNMEDIEIEKRVEKILYEYFKELRYNLENNFQICHTEI